MKQYISTAAAALALVGAIGLAYAQGEPQPANTDTSAQQTPQTPQDPNQPVMNNDTVTTPPSAASANTTSISTSTDVQPTGDTAMTTERPPQADRN
jgi:hypothetical protein